MNQLQKILDKAFNTLSAIPVCGDQVELMAHARELLRTAYRQAGAKEDGSDG